MEHSQHDHMAGHDMTTTAAPSSADDHHSMHHQQHDMHAEAAAPSATHHGGGHQMTFHGGFDEVILFHGWRISSMTGLVVAWCLIFALAIAYEGIKFVRERIDAHCPCVGKEPCCQSNGVNAGTTSSAVLANANSESGTSPIRLIVPSTQGERFRRAMRMPSHWLQAGLNMLQIFVAYLLMLIFMTFNSWLCSSIILGSGVGYLFFGWPRRFRANNAPIGDVSDHCM